MDVSADSLIETLRNEGLRITSARRAICEIVASQHDDHLTAADLQSAAEELIGSNIDASTVYRTIEVFERFGVAHHVHLGHGPGVIHLSGHEQHHHLTCETCGKTTDIDQSVMAEAFEKIRVEYGFTVDPLHFALSGHCRECEHSRNNS